MPDMTFELPLPSYTADGTPNNVSAWLLAGFDETHPDYEGSANALQRGKMVVTAVMKDWLDGVKRRYFQNALTFDDTKLG